MWVGELTRAFNSGESFLWLLSFPKESSTTLTNGRVSSGGCSIHYSLSFIIIKKDKG